MSRKYIFFFHFGANIQLLHRRNTIFFEVKTLNSNPDATIFQKCLHSFIVWIRVVIVL